MLELTLPEVADVLGLPHRRLEATWQRSRDGTFHPRVEMAPGGDRVLRYWFGEEDIATFWRLAIERELDAERRKWDKRAARQHAKLIERKTA